MTDFFSLASKARSTDQRAWLGVLTWYSVTGTLIRHEDLAQALTDAGLDTYIPRAPRNEDVFRRVAPNGQFSTEETEDENVIVHFLIRQVKRGGGSCIKHIVCETVDAAGERLGYEAVYELRYDGEKDTLTGRWLVPYADGPCAGAELVANQIMARYDARKGMLESVALRTIIRAVMDSARATNVRPTGGVFFVPGAHADKVAALEAMSAKVNGCSMHSLPLVDEKRQRDMLREAFEAESIEEVERSLGELAELLADKESELTPQQYARYSARYTALVDKTQEYAGLLEENLDTTTAKLDIYRRQMSQLLHHVKVD